MLLLIGWIVLKESGGVHTVEGLGLVVLSRLLLAFSGRKVCGRRAGGMVQAIAAGVAVALALVRPGSARARGRHRLWRRPCRAGSARAVVSSLDGGWTDKYRGRFWSSRVSVAGWR
jgi:hypothetical protein